MPNSDVTAQAEAHFRPPDDPGAALVLACARLPLDPTAAETIREAAAGDLDWRGAADLTFAHRLASLVDWGLREAGVEPDVGGHHRDLLREARQTNGARTVLLADRTREVLTALDQGGVRTMVLKGLALAEHCYPAPDLRPMADGDIIVPAGQLRSAAEVLRSLDYEIAPLSTTQTVYATPRQRAGSAWDYCFEVATEVLLGRLGTRKVRRFQAEDLWRQARPRPLLDAPTQAPAPEDELLFLAAHLSVHHGDFCLIWLCDLSYFVASSEPALDWQAFVRRASEAGLEPAAWIALAIARSYVGCPVPEDALAALAPPAATWERLRRVVRVPGLVGEDFPLAPWRQVLGRRAFLSTVGDRSWYLASLARGLLLGPGRQP